ncbi:hypothetical protein D1BOALGB6SA_6815 [Olavius sp. associated proteobacterium Delta 1]|nr:hypothetical protein D1BOALGB6SA_6815 [Olavius sp. associated proteobacterium Delta 1]
MSGVRCQQKAEWMITIETGCCLRPLGGVVNEQATRTNFI